MCPDLVVGGDVGGGAGANNAGGHRAVTVTLDHRTNMQIQIQSVVKLLVVCFDVLKLTQLMFSAQPPTLQGSFSRLVQSNPELDSVPELGEAEPDMITSAN